MSVTRQAVTTLVMHQDGGRVLMGRRSSVGAFPNQLVFPGGVIEPHDSSESWGESYTGAHGLGLEERARRVAGARELFEETGVQLRDLSQMYPVSRWITPAHLPVRFDTWFYILELPEGQEPVTDGVELVTLEWVEPVKQVEAFTAGTLPLMLPTIAHLARLAEFGQNWRGWPSDARTTLNPINPLVSREADGSTLVRIPNDVGFSFTEMLLPVSV